MSGKPVSVEFYTESHRILGRLNPGTSGLYSFLNIPTTSTLEIEGPHLKKAVTKTGVVKQTLTVPNFWTDELATSTVIVAEKVEPLAAPLSQREQVEQPYTLGTTQILPSLTNTFSKKGELSLEFLIYNPVLGADKKPDVSVEYSFYQKLASEATGEKFFNKTNPQMFSAKTLPPQFDTALGHQLVAGSRCRSGVSPKASTGSRSRLPTSSRARR